jgi:hypothetical protein
MEDTRSVQSAVAEAELLRERLVRAAWALHLMASYLAAQVADEHGGSAASAHRAASWDAVAADALDVARVWSHGRSAQLAETSVGASSRRLLNAVHDS